MPLDLNKAVEHEHDGLLEDARMAASTGWEESFVADQLANREKYGARWRPTDGQVDKLREIADGPGFDGLWPKSDF